MMTRIAAASSGAWILLLLAIAPAVGGDTKARPSAALEPLGALTYTLTSGSAGWPASKRTRIVEAMDEAGAIYNRFAPFQKALRVSYDPAVPTADGNVNGHIRFGDQISTRTALHEISHTLGIGTTPQWRARARSRRWTSPGALALLQAFDGEDAVLHVDRQHFWPYGLNYAREDGTTQRIRHVLLVERLCRDLSLPVFRDGRR